MRFRFASCVVDTGSRELLRDGKPVHLTGKAFRLLEVLLDNQPNALSKDQLQDLVWPGVFVSEANLTSLVAELRVALGDAARDPKVIRTVYGFGYSFCGQLAEEKGTAVKRSGVSRFRLRWARKEIVLAEGENILGRGPESIEWIEGTTVSRRHARITVDGERATIEDLGSKNGTFLRGKPVHGSAAIGDGDEIGLGTVSLKVRLLAGPGSTATPSGGQSRRR